MISRLRRHLRSGTLLDVSGRWLHSRFNTVRWHCAGYTILPLASGNSIKLYRDSRLSKLIRYGDFERAERIFLARFLRPNDIFVDVGANIGLYSVLAAPLVGDGGRVIAFEPCRRTFGRLSENIRRNGFQNTHCVHAALSDHSGTCHLYAAKDERDAWNSLARPTGSETFTAEETVTMTWDDYSTAHALENRATLMKIDVEGWELAVLNGASRGLSQPNAPVLQVEFCEETARSANSSCAALFDRLVNLGYRLYEYDLPANEVRHVARDLATGNRNLYAIKDLPDVVARLNKSPRESF